MSKKVFAIIMAAAMMLACLAGCGNDAPASSKAVIKIGGIGPITGDAAIYGQAVMNACQIAVDEINAAGGVNGMKFELAFEDSEGDPESAVNAYGKLMDDGMDVSLGAVLSGENTSVSAAAAADGILLLSASIQQHCAGCSCLCAALNTLLIGALGTIFFAVILLAVGIVATSIVSAILVGLLLFFLSLLISATACLIRYLFDCGN